MRQADREHLRALLVIGLAVGFYIAVKGVERALLIRFLRSVRISVDELRELFERREKPVILDARSAAARRLDPRRIPGALPVDINGPERGLPQVAPGQEIVIYCT